MQSTTDLISMPRERALATIKAISRVILSEKQVDFDCVADILILFD